MIQYGSAAMAGVEVGRNSCMGTVLGTGYGGGLFVAWAFLNVTSSVVHDNIAGIGDGGGVAALDSDVTLNGTTFAGNRARQGGGLHFLGGSAHAISLGACAFTGNTAASAGGALAVSAAVWGALTDSAFESNTAASGDGGAVLLVSVARALGDFVVAGASFVKNSAPAGLGGALALGNTSATVRRCAFSGNAALSGGGVLADARSVLALVGTALARNWARDDGGAVASMGGPFSATACDVHDNAGGRTGGGISLWVSRWVNATLVACRLANNVVGVGGAGGGLYAGGVGALCVTNSTLVSNAAGKGGAVYLQSLRGVVIVGSHVSGNAVTTSGGGLHALRVSNLVVSLSTLYNNSAGISGLALYSEASAVVVHDTTVSGHSTGAGAVLAFVASSNSTLSGVYMADNVVHDSPLVSFSGVAACAAVLTGVVAARTTIVYAPSLSGGNAWGVSAWFLESYVPTDVRSCTIEPPVVVGTPEGPVRAVVWSADWPSLLRVSNTAFAGPTAALMCFRTGSVLVVNCSVRDTADTAIVSYNTHMSVSGSTFDSVARSGIGAYGGTLSITSTVFAGGTGGPASFRYASAVFSELAALSMIDCVVTRGTSDGSGAVSVRGACGAVARVVFSGNVGMFGALSVSSTSCVNHANASSFLHNRAFSIGGGALFRDSVVSIAWCAFAQNTAWSGGAIAAIGGGAGSGVSMRLYETSFVRNAASDSGGALHLDSVGSAADRVVLELNSAAQGGAAYVLSSLLRVRNSSFWQNAASKNGGGVKVVGRSTLTLESVSTFQNVAYVGGFFDGADSTLTMTDCTVSGNRASVGGALSFSSIVWASVAGCSFRDNADLYFAGTVVAMNGGGVIVRDTVVSNSSSDGHAGAAVGARGTYFDIANSTFSGNRGAGGGVMVSSGGQVCACARMERCAHRVSRLVMPCAFASRLRVHTHRSTVINIYVIFLLVN